MKKLILTLSLILPLLYLSSCKTAQTASKQTSTDEQAMLKALAWQEANPIQAKAPTDWTNGAYYTGVMKAHQSTQNPIFLKALVDMGNRNQWKTYDRLYHADDVAISNAYLYLKEIGNNEVQLGPTDAFIQAHLFEPQDWKVGKGNAEQVILWWWCDALFMAPPVLTKYSKLKKDEKYLDEMHKYYAETKKLLYDDEEKLFFRDNRFLWKGQATDRKENNGRKIFWSRGNGWVLGGLAMILEDMPKNYKHHDFYVDLYKTMSKRILELQHPDGLWRTSLLAPENFSHGEVSGSGFFTYALAWGINNGHLDAKTYKPAVQKAWAALKDCQQETGKVGWVQNIGFDPKPADKDSWQNFGTGAFLLAGSEMLKLK